jgi:type VI secretion system secreted protein Hcp
MAVDYFLKLEGIEGESADAKHTNEIDILSWGWGEHQAGAHAGGGGGGSGKVSMQDFNFLMRVNKASPKLLLACANGQHIKNALLTCRKAGKDQQEYMKIKFTDLLVSSYQTGGSPSEEVPVDKIALNFAKIEYEYYPQKADGTLGSKIPVHWDLKQNKGG